MTVRRIVANFQATDIGEAASFYADVLGMRVAMDHGWIVTFTSDATMTAQVSVATEGGSGTPVPDLSIEVDDLDAVLRALTDRGIAPVYGPAVEPWGVRRFFVRDPFGRLVNVLSHD